MQRLACLRLDGRSAVPTGGEPVFAAGTCVGYVTSAEYGATADAVLALAWLDRDHARVDDHLTVRYLGRTIGATVVREPVVDPAGRRLRA